MAWKYLQYDGETGKKRTVNGGSGGASSLADLDDTNISNPSDGQILKFDAQNNKWVNDDESGGYAHHYSTTEHIIGTWIDGKPIYEKVLIPTETISLIGNTWVKTEYDKGNIKSIKNLVIGNDTYGSLHIGLSGGFVDGKLAINSFRDVSYASDDSIYIILQYTKTTDV